MQLLDALIENIQRVVPWGMLFADDVVLIEENKEKGEENLERWKCILNRNGMEISRNKTMHKGCRFNDTLQKDNKPISRGDGEESYYQLCRNLST